MIINDAMFTGLSNPLKSAPTLVVTLVLVGHSWFENVLLFAKLDINSNINVIFVGGPLCFLLGCI